MARAASAIFSGVSRLAGSFARARVKFCDSARIRPRVTAGFFASHDRRPIRAISSRRLYSGPVRSRPKWRLPPRRRRNRPRRMRLPSATAMRSDSLGLQEPHRSGDQLAHLRGIEFSALPAPASSTRLAAVPGAPCNKVNSSGLPATSPDSRKFRRAEAAFLGVFHYRHDEGVGLNLFQRSSFSSGLHHFRLCPT